MELVRQDRIGCFTQQVARERARQGLEMPWAGAEGSRWVLVGGWRGHRSGRPGWGGTRVAALAEGRGVGGRWKEKDLNAPPPPTPGGAP